MSKLTYDEMQKNPVWLKADSLFDAMTSNIKWGYGHAYGNIKYAVKCLSVQEAGFDVSDEWNDDLKKSVDWWWSKASPEYRQAMYDRLMTIVRSANA